MDVVRQIGERLRVKLTVSAPHLLAGILWKQRKLILRQIHKANSSGKDLCSAGWRRQWDSKQRPHHSTAALETPPRSKGPPLCQKQSHKSILGKKGKKENFYGPSWGYVKSVQMGKPEKAWVWKETSPYQEEGLFLLGFSDWRLSHSSLVSFW